MEMVEITNQELRNEFKTSKVVLESHNNDKKYSEIFHAYMSEAINELIDDENGLKIILNFGQMIWNKGVAENFPNHPKSKDMEAIFPKYKAQFSDHSLIDYFLIRKRVLFCNENFFIVKQTSLLGSNGRLAISVVVDQIKDSI